MKKLFALLPLCLIAAALWAQPAIIPQPVHTTPGEGTFILPEQIGIEAPDLPGMKHPLELLRSALNGATGYSCTLNDKTGSAAIRLVHAPASGIPKEGYMLNVGRSQIILSAADAAGFFTAYKPCCSCCLRKLSRGRKQMVSPGKFRACPSPIIRASGGAD